MRRFCRVFFLFASCFGRTSKGYPSTCIARKDEVPEVPITLRTARWIRLVPLAPTWNQRWNSLKLWKHVKILISLIAALVSYHLLSLISEVIHAILAAKCSSSFPVARITAAKPVWHSFHGDLLSVLRKDIHRGERWDNDKIACILWMYSKQTKHISTSTTLSCQPMNPSTHSQVREFGENPTFLVMRSTRPWLRTASCNRKTVMRWSPFSLHLFSTAFEILQIAVFSQPPCPPSPTAGLHLQQGLPHKFAWIPGLRGACNTFYRLLHRTFQNFEKTHIADQVRCGTLIWCMYFLNAIWFFHVTNFVCKTSRALQLCPVEHLE